MLISVGSRKFPFEVFSRNSSLILIFLKVSNLHFEVINISPYFFAFVRDCMQRFCMEG